MAWRLLRALVLCTPWTCFSGDPVGPGEGSPRCEPRTHFGCELAARFGPSSVHYTWLPKRMPVRAEPGPKSGPRFCLPSLRTSYQARGARVAGYLASGPAGAAVSALLTCSHNSAKPRGRQYQKPCCISQGVMAALPRRAEFQILQSSGGLLCTWCKGSCRRSFVASVPRQQPSAAYDWLSVPGLFQGSYCRIWQNSSVQVATRTMQVISNGDLLCSDNMGSCRRSFDAQVRRKQSFATNRWLLSCRPISWKPLSCLAGHAVKVTTLNVHMISNGGLLCSGNTGSCRRSFDAPVRRKLHFATCCRLTLFGSARSSGAAVDSAGLQPTTRTVRVVSSQAVSLRELWHLPSAPLGSRFLASTGQATFPYDPLVLFEYWMTLCNFGE